MEGFVGADVDGMAGLARALDDGAERLESARMVIERLLGEVAWAGYDAEDFHGAWGGALGPAMMAAVSALRSASQTVDANAKAQEQASAVEGVTAAQAAGPAAVGEDAVPVAMAAAPTTTGHWWDGFGDSEGSGYVVGPPKKPQIAWDEDFIYDSEKPTEQDKKDWDRWGRIAFLSQFHPGLQDASAFYRHYRSNTGKPMTFDYESAYSKDAQVKANVDEEIARAQVGVERLIASGNGPDFQMTGSASGTSHYPETENWQKTIGDCQQWSSADVHVDGDKVTMTITVHAEDYYNFNRGQSDIASGTPDDVNGRFTEIGWAKPFETSGEVVRVVTWTIGDAENAKVESDGGRS